MFKISISVSYQTMAVSINIVNIGDQYWQYQSYMQY